MAAAVQFAPTAAAKAKPVEYPTSLVVAESWVGSASLFRSAAGGPGLAVAETQSCANTQYSKW